MKALARFVIVAVFVVHATCETCTVDDDCTSTTCVSGSYVICEHPSGGGIVPNGGLCTCAEDHYECYVRSDCFSPNAPHLNCPDSTRHCYDNTCICSRWPPS